VSAVAQSSTPHQEKSGFAYWMDRVLEEHSKLSGELLPKPVHDLRVTLRRCLLIASVMKIVDPASGWKPMRKAGRRLFHSLGELRDTEMLMEWVKRLGSSDDPATVILLKGLKAKHEQNIAATQDRLKEFDRKQWRAWANELSSHYRHVASNRPACESLILEIWESVLELHRRARKNQSRVGYHRLRVKLKKFRYAVENFLPSTYTVWAPDLKFLQDLLGEMHDLDVLAQTIVRDRHLAGEASRAAWIQKLAGERSSRLRQYRAKMVGNTSPLWIWREGLLAERELRSAGLARMTEWSYFVTPDFPRVRRTARLALQLYDGLTNCGLITRESNIDERFILRAAALLQEIGRLKKGKSHHKESYRMIRRSAPPAGWSKRDLELVALVARFHRRALPRPDHKVLKDYELPLRQSLVLLSAILRFANAFHAKPYRAVRRIEVENSSGAIVVRADGFPESDPLASKLSVARRLMEFACQHPVHILASGTRIMATRLVRPAPRSDAA
jgi:CHAD domain-containing protein